jgi:hypothetical protein
MRVPDVRLLEQALRSTLRDAAGSWRASRVDVSDGTKLLHRVSLDRSLLI